MCESDHSGHICSYNVRTSTVCHQLLTCHLLLVGRWAGEASAFGAHIFPVIVQPVLEHVDRSRLDNVTWQSIPCVDVAEEILPDLSGCLWLVEFQTVAGC